MDPHVEIRKGLEEIAFDPHEVQYFKGTEDQIREIVKITWAESWPAIYPKLMRGEVYFNPSCDRTNLFQKNGQPATKVTLHIFVKSKDYQNRATAIELQWFTAYSANEARAA